MIEGAAPQLQTAKAVYLCQPFLPHPDCRDISNESAMRSVVSGRHPFGSAMIESKL